MIANVTASAVQSLCLATGSPVKLPSGVKHRIFGIAHLAFHTF